MPLIDDRTYQIAIRVQGSPDAVYRSPWLTRTQAAEMLRRKREEIRQAGTTHRAEAFYRTGENVSEELLAQPNEAE